jgi:Family of unknown function (DUF6504)
MRQLDENVSVSTNQNGEPVGFLWRDSIYKVSAKPIRWFARRDWWLEASRVQKGIGPGVLEVEIWRMTAAEVATANKTQFEIAHTQDNDGGKNLWRLVRVYD